jgi:hypothetical protein
MTESKEPKFKIDDDALIDTLFEMRDTLAENVPFSPDVDANIVLQVVKFVQQIADDAYDAGYQAACVEGGARQALLDGQAHWLQEADDADNTTMRSVSRLIAESFQQWADRYRSRPRPELDDNTSHNDVADFFEREEIKNK